MKLNYTLDNLINKWCNSWNIEKPELIIVNDLGYHQIINNKSVIALNMNKPYLIQRLLHELRHHYQSTIYKEFYIWWSDNFLMYDFFYNSPLCIIEEDANIFSWTNGKKNGECLFEIIDIDYIKTAYNLIKSNKKTIYDYNKEIQRIEIANNVSDWRFYRRNILSA